MTIYSVYCAGRFIDFFYTKHEACQAIALCRLAFYSVDIFDNDDKFEIKEEVL